MKKKELVDALVEKTQLAKKDVVMVLDEMAEIVKATVKKEAVEIPGLVKVEKKHRAARMGRNPMTGASISIPAKTVLKAKVLKKLKDAVM
ncbi:MAG TPA: HU family DNA-binding protein [Candidatus Bathyarchaeia archaeon]|nr:HU family DNA-binding protein [Candidatus Bathyarchaeia archaeon]